MRFGRHSLVGAGLLAALLLLGAGCQRGSQKDSRPGGSSPSGRPAHAKGAPSEAALPLLDYVEVVTAGAEAEATLPLIIAVHGLGDRPERFIRWLRALPFPARVIAPRGPAARGRGFSWFPVTIPYDPEAPQRIDRMRSSTDRLAALITHLERTRPTRGKPVITGFSQGGILSYAVAAHYPDRIAGAVPISGGLPKAYLPGAGQRGASPIYGLHGDADRIVPLGSAKLAAEALRRGKRTVVLKVFPGVGHTISPAMRQWAFERLGELTR